MFYVYHVEVLPNTTEDDPTIQVMSLAPGEIHQVEIGFPWGCAGLVHVQLWSAEHQVWPTNVGESFYWNDYNDVFSESLTCSGAPEHWTVRAWNEDVRHAHVVCVRIGVLELKKMSLGQIAQALFSPARKR